MNRVVALALTAFVVAGCSTREPATDGTDGITHWLTCVQDDECASDTACRCGRCIRQCNTDADCDGLDPTATCVDSDEVSSEACSAAPARVCAPECATSGDCGRLTPRNEEQTVADAGITPSGDGSAENDATASTETDDLAPDDTDSSMDSGTTAMSGDDAGNGSECSDGADCEPEVDTAGDCDPLTMTCNDVEAPELAPNDSPDAFFQVARGPSCDDRVPAPQPAAACPADLCGNEEVDSCVIENAACSGQGECFDMTQYESCDGMNLDGRDCVTMGFAGGELRCSDACRFDVRGCAACSAGSAIESCQRLDDMFMPALSGVFDLASNGSRAAVIWVEQTASSSNGRLRFGLIGDDSSVTTATDCLGDASVNLFPSLAALPTGWLVAYSAAVDSSTGIHFMRFDAEGNPVDAPAPMQGVLRKLVDRSDGAPLLIHESADGVINDTGRYERTLRATLLDETGEPQWTVDVAGSEDPDEPVADYTGDGFLIAKRERVGEPTMLTHLSLNAEISRRELEIDDTLFYADLVWTGSEARLFFDEFFVRLDNRGALLGTPQSLLDTDASQPKSASLQGQTVTLIRTQRTGVALDMIGPAAEGSGWFEMALTNVDGLTTDAFPVLIPGNQGPAFEHRLVSVGDAVIAAAVVNDAALGLGNRVYLIKVRP